MTHHYSGSYPAARLRVGLFERGELVGVAVYSEPANVRAISAWTRDAYARHEGVELGRFVLLDEVGFNAESFFWARCRRLLREHKPDVRVILAYSDPIRREALDGTVVMPGHIGQIYQATNGAYLGRGSARTLHLDHEGQVVSARVLSKIVSGARGARYARALLEEASQTTQRARESPRDWVTRAKGGLRRLRHRTEPRLRLGRDAPQTPSPPGCLHHTTQTRFSWVFSETSPEFYTPQHPKDPFMTICMRPPSMDDPKTHPFRVIDGGIDSSKHKGSRTETVRTLIEHEGVRIVMRGHTEVWELTEPGAWTGEKLGECPPFVAFVLLEVDCPRAVLETNASRWFMRCSNEAIRSARSRGARATAARRSRHGCGVIARSP